jgi:hypothetical protein
MAVLDCIVPTFRKGDKFLQHGNWGFEQSYQQLYSIDHKYMQQQYPAYYSTYPKVVP